MMKFLIKLRKNTILRWRNTLRKQDIMDGDIVLPGSLVLSMLDEAKVALSEAQRSERKPDAERLDGEIKILTWLLQTYVSSKN